MAKGFKENCESIATYWNTKKGLAFFYLTFSVFYYNFLIDFINQNILNNKLINICFIPLISFLLMYVIWAAKSHRINLYKKKILTTGIFLKCNDSNSEIRIKEILNDLLDELREEFNDIKFKLFPINHVKTKPQLVRFVKNNNHIIDNAFFATIYNGNCIEDSQTIAKIEIQKIIFCANLSNCDHLDFRNNVNMSHDLNIRDLNKDWEYVESKSFNDKSKIKHNFKDSLLFFNGLHSIYMREYDLALKVFKFLKQGEKSETDFISQAQKYRLNDILLRLFTFNAFEKYINKKDRDSAFTILKDCEILFKENHRFSFDNFITLARIYFEKGNVQMAKDYTEKAKELNRLSPAIYLNFGFFGLIENNPEQVFENYKELAHVYRYANKVNFLEVIDFIELHKNKYPESVPLFDFAIASINFLYADKVLGKRQLLEVRETLKSILSYNKIYDLASMLLEKGDIKSPYFHRDKKRTRGS